MQLLFADASTGANSPALVRQGQISELIGAKPQNRRRILEEAAGIGGLAARRHEAELKLKAADENLERLAEIMAEVERQAAALKRQAGKARKYQALSDEIAALEARLGAARWRGAVTEQAEADALRSTPQRKPKQTTVSAVTRAATAELEARAAIDPLRAAESEAAGHLGVMKLQLARLEAERDAAREAVARLDRDIKRLVEDATRETTQRDDADARAKRAARRRSPPCRPTIPAAPRDDSAELAAAVDAAMRRAAELRSRSRRAPHRAGARRSRSRRRRNRRSSASRIATPASTPTLRAPTPTSQRSATPPRWKPR